MELQPIYSVLDSPSNAEKNATYEKSSPWKNADISFYWTNFDYPFLHTHKYYETFIVIEGKITHFINGKQHTMQTGDAWIIRPSDEHKFCSVQNLPVKTLNFVLKSDFAESLLRLYDVNISTVSDAKNLSFKLGTNKMREIADETILIQSLKNTSLGDKILRTKILYDGLFGEFVKQNVIVQKNVPKWIESLLITLADPLLTEVSVKKQLAAYSNYSYSNMIRLFKKHTGYTVIEYIHLKKIEYAEDLLAHSDKQILEIASLSGYDSLSHFNHLFKRHTGLTPSEYRKNLKNTGN